jgi:hypothetical protein
VILRSNGGFGRDKPPNALRAKWVEKEEEEEVHPELLKLENYTGIACSILRIDKR